jgi:prevent-host-death family protein
MKKMTSTSAKTNFGEVLTTSQREPVIVEKNGKAIGVVISYEAFKDYQETMKAQDRYWGELADQAKEMMGVEKSAKFFKDFGK